MHNELPRRRARDRGLVRPHGEDNGLRLERTRRRVQVFYKLQMRAHGVRVTFVNPLDLAIAIIIMTYYESNVIVSICLES